MSFKVYTLYGQNGHYTWASLVGHMSFKAFRSLIASLGYSIVEYCGPRSEAAISVSKALNLPAGCFWIIQEKVSPGEGSKQTAYYGVSMKPYDSRRKGKN